MTYRFHSMRGEFHIRRQEDRRWHVWFQGADIGRFPTARLAARAVATCVSYDGLLGASETRGLPQDIDDWGITLPHPRDRVAA